MTILLNHELTQKQKQDTCTTPNNVTLHFFTKQKNINQQFKTKN